MHKPNQLSHKHCYTVQGVGSRWGFWLLVYSDVGNQGCILLSIAAELGDLLRKIIGLTHSLHCSSCFWFNQFFIKGPKR